MEQALKAKLQLYLINSIKTLNNSETNVYKLLKIVDYVMNSARSSDENQNEEAIFQAFENEFKDYSKASVQSEFVKSFYSVCLSQLLGNFNPNLSTVSERTTSPGYVEVKELFIKVISSAQFSESFNVIYELCLNLRHDKFSLWT